MAANRVWGLDIGNSAIKAVKMERVGNDCKIADFDIIDISCEDDKDRSLKLQSAMTTLVTTHKFGKDPVYISVAGNICMHREFQLPPGSEDKLRDLVQYEAKQQIPIPLEQVEWGFERYEDPAGVGVALVAVRKNDIQELLSLAETNNIVIKGITASPMALFNFIHYEFKPENTSLILDAGAKGTDFVVMNKRRVYFRTIQIAGREITRVLENKFKVGYTKAEELKKNIAQSAQMDKILSVIEPTLRQLGAEVQRTIGFYKAKASGQRIHQCYLLGHTFRLPKMADFLQAQVREAPFTMVEGLQKVKLDKSVNPEVWQNEFPTMAVAIGLGIQGLGLSELNMNLIPESVMQVEVASNWKRWMAATAAVVALTVGLSYVQANKTNAQFTERAKNLEADKLLVEQNDKDEKAATAGLPEKKLLLERWSRVAHDRGKLAQVLTRLCNLKTADGKNFFGQENKIFLTNLYASRIPLDLGLSLSDPGVADRSYLAKLDMTRIIYTPLAKADAALPAETRADAPLIVVLSGEVENSAASQQLLNLQETLRKLPEVVKEADVRIEHKDAALNYTDIKFERNFGGEWVATTANNPAANPAGDAPNPEKASQKYTYTVFHAIFRWNDLSDPDVLSEPPAPAAAPAVAAPSAPK